MMEMFKNIGDPLLNLYTLLFKDEKLEAQYRISNSNRHFLSQRLILLTGILFFAAFGLYDFSVQPYNLEEILFARLAVFTPVMLTLWIISTLNQSKKHINLLASLIVILTASGISYVIYLSPFHVADSYTYGLVLTLIFGFILVDIRFLSSLLNYIVLTAIYFLVIMQKPHLPSDYLGKQIILMFSLGLTLMIGRYTIEFYKRIDFLTRTKLEEEKEKVKKAFQREKLLNDAKGRFTNVIAHVFRTPLATIQNSIHILEHKSKNAGLDVEKEADMLLRSTENIAYNIERAQFIIKFDSGKIKKEISTFSVKDLVEEVKKDILRLESLNRDFRIDIKDECHTITSDRYLVKLILTNFVSNAAKFSRRNSEIIISCNKPTDNNIEFQVSDSGYGIPEQQLQNIFEVYYHFSSDPMIMGLGLGLAIIKRCSDMLKAEVRLVSEEHKGTQAFLKLPIMN